jgi:glycosyltransferase involved in cell wall biosynthesis
VAGSSEQEITVVIPAFNEEQTVGAVVREVLKHVPQARVLVVDDGSTDGTAREALDAGAFVVSHPLNKGNGASIKTALRSIDGGIVAIVDGDGQHDPADLPAMLEKLGEFDLVVAARSFGNGNGRPLRNTGNIFLRFLASFLAEQKIPDLTGGFRAFRHDVAIRFLHVYPNGYSFPSTSTLCFVTAGYNVGFVPTRVRDRHNDTRSKLHPFRDGLRFLQFILRIISMANPNKVFFPTGLFMVLVGLILTVRSLMLFVQFSSGGVLFLAGGINVIFFGLVLDQFASIRIQERDHHERL